MTRDLRRVLVTGVSRGIGRAMVEEFIRLGHTVLGCARDGEAIRELSKRHGPPHDFSALDLSDWRQVQTWSERLLQLGEPPDLIVNNAGVINRNAVLWEISAEEFSLVIDVNLKGVAHVIRALVPAMVSRRRGVIVNMSSGWGRVAAAEEGPYVASKWAVEGLSRSLAAELPRGMACVPLSPGIIETDMTRTCFQGRTSGLQTPEEWARKAVPHLLTIGPADNGKPLISPGGDL